VNKRDHKILRKRKRSLKRRLKRKNYQEQSEPMMKQPNITYEMADRTQAVGCGGIGAIHRLVGQLKLDKAINERVKVLKAHIPYFESDHVLNIAYNVMCGGTSLEDIEKLRNNETYMNCLGADRIPDPTTEGDYLRRYDRESIIELQEAINESRVKVWMMQDKSFGDEAIIDSDGTIAETGGECKEGMDMSYKGVWGYGPLIVSLANTGEPMYVVNRPGSQPSSTGAAEWIDRAIDLVAPVFAKTTLRGDTDFSLTQNFDRWDEKGVKFVFGYDAFQSLRRMADEIPDGDWKPLERSPRYEVRTRERGRRENVKERIVKEREYKNISLTSEQVAEFEYKPKACKKSYRMVVVRKNLSVEKGENKLFDEIRYFFYVTNDREKTAEEVVLFANKRGNQENLIGQLKSGINALRMPSDGLDSNWAYMVIATLAWSLKAWSGLMVEVEAASKEIIRMEFKRYLATFIRIPCQILKTGRRLVYRILSYNEHLETFLKTFTHIKHMTFY
jgi:hypothetical protein